MLKYEQIVWDFCEMIQNGSMKPGEKLPSIREACVRYACNKATVIRAYQQLEDRHFTTVKSKSGFYVLDIGTAKKETTRIEFGFDRVELQKEMIPYKDFQHCLTHAIEKGKVHLFCRSEQKGQQGLIHQISKTFMKQQVFADEDNIVITSGIQQALSLLCRIPFNCCKDTVLVEQPTFRGILYALKHAGVQAVGIERTYEGLDVDRVEQIFRSGRIKFFYIQPRFHNPLSTHLPAAQKRDLISLARKYDVYLVEDDYMADHDNTSINDPLAAGNLDRVVYLRSFSKILLPEIRIGAAVLPEDLVQSFSEYKKWNDLSTSILTQGALEVYLKSGLMERHIPPIQRAYQDRMAAAKEVMANQCPYPYHVPDSGLFFSIELPSSSCLTTLMGDLKNQNILINGSQDFYIEGFRQKNILRVSVANQTVDAIRSELPRILTAAIGLRPAEKIEQWL